jgi:hypothetical protein
MGRSKAECPLLTAHRVIRHDALNHTVTCDDTHSTELHIRPQDIQPVNGAQTLRLNKRRVPVYSYVVAVLLEAVLFAMKIIG